MGGEAFRRKKRKSRADRKSAPFHIRGTLGLAEMGGFPLNSPDVRTGQKGITGWSVRYDCLVFPSDSGGIETHPNSIIPLAPVPNRRRARKLRRPAAQERAGAGEGKRG